MSSSWENKLDEVCQWRNWCRICGSTSVAKHYSIYSKCQIQPESLNESECLLADVIDAFLHIEVRQPKQPERVCSFCYDAIVAFCEFVGKVQQVQGMFGELDEKTVRDRDNLKAIRQKYLEDEQLQMPACNATEFVQSATTSSSRQKLKFSKRKEALFAELSSGEEISDNTETATEVMSEAEEIVSAAEEQIKENNEPVQFMADAVQLATLNKDNPHSNELNVLLDSANTIAFPVATDKQFNDFPSADTNELDQMQELDKIGATNEPVVKWVASDLLQQDPEHPSKILVDRKTAELRIQYERNYPYACAYCPHRFSRRNGMLTHLRIRHPNGANKAPLMCPVCRKIMFSQTMLKCHVSTHFTQESRRHIPCPQCDNLFSSELSLRSHIKYVHNNERDWICEVCGVRKSTKHLLINHMHCHSNVKAYKCDLCEKRYKKSGELRKHHSTHYPERNVCQLCGKVLNSVDTLRNHMRVHSDKRPQKCDYCGKCFKMSKSLKMHLVTHTHLEPFTCNFCGKKFSSNSVVRGHLRKKHAEEMGASEDATGYTTELPLLADLKAMLQNEDNLVLRKPRQKREYFIRAKQRATKEPLKATNEINGEETVTTNEEEIKEINTNTNTETIMQDEEDLQINLLLEDLTGSTMAQTQ